MIFYTIVNLDALSDSIASRLDEYKLDREFIPCLSDTRCEDLNLKAFNNAPVNTETIIGARQIFIESTYRRVHK